MQYATDTALAAAIANPERLIDGLLEFDWDRDGSYAHQYSDLSWLLTSVMVDSAAITGDLPEQVNTVVGHSSAELTAVLGGPRFGADVDAEIAALLNDEWNHALAAQGMSAEQLFSPYWAPSPLYRYEVPGTPVRYSRVEVTATGERTVRQFTGHVRSFQIDSNDMSVTIVASDVLHMQNAPVTLPRWARMAEATDPAAACSRPIETTWVIEEAFRQAGVPTGPRQNYYAVGYWSGNGSLLPSVGTITDQSAWGDYPHGLRWQESPIFRNGRYGLAITPSPYPLDQEGEYRHNYSVATTERPIVCPGSVSGTGPDELIVGFSGWFEIDAEDPGTLLAPSYRSARQSWMYFCTERREFPEIGGDWALSLFALHGIHFRVFADGRARLQLWDARNHGDGQGHERARWHFDSQLPRGWHYYDFRVRLRANAAPVLESAHVDDQPVPTSVGVAPTGPFVPDEADSVPGRFNRMNPMKVYTNLSCQHLQIYAARPDQLAPYQAGQGDPPRREGRPLASLPAGSHGDLTYIPATTRTPAWELLKELAAAELAVLYTDEFGTVHFVPNYQMRIETEKDVANAVTITDDQLLGRMVNPTDDQYRNIVVVPFTERWAEKRHIWTLSDWRTLVTEPGTTIQFHPVNDFMSVLTSSATNLWDFLDPTTGEFEIRGGVPAGISGAVAVNSASSNAYLEFYWTLIPEVDPDGHDGFYLRRYLDPNAGIPQIQYTKRYGHSPIVDSPSSGDFDPFLYISGHAYGEAQSDTREVANTAEVAARGARVIEMPDNPWRSFGDSATALGESILRDTITPAPVIDGVEIPADPRLQLRDVVKLTSETGITGAVFAQIIGIRREDSVAGSIDRLTLRVVRTPGEWILGDPDLSILGVTTILGAGA